MYMLWGGGTMERVGNGNPLPYSCLENPLNRGAWWATVHRVTKNQRQLKRLSMDSGPGGGGGQLVSNGDRASVWEDGKVLETDGGYGCTAV